VAPPPHRIHARAILSELLSRGGTSSLCTSVNMKPMTSYAVVFVGAGLGGALRHAVNVLASRAMRPELPVATFVVNVVGSFAAGLLLGYFLARGDDAATFRLFAITGVLGGFTTFSAYSLELTRMIERGAFGGALGYAVGSVVLSVAAAFLGLAVARS
jgi:fluoride exporter